MHNPHQLAASIRDDRDNFDMRFAVGRGGEKDIASILLRAGYNVLETGQIASATGAPKIATPTTPIIVTDLFVWRGVVCRWVECKCKDSFTWHRNTQQFQFGINKHQVLDYQAAERTSPWPVFVMVIVRGGHVKDCPHKTSPKGLFGQKLSVLSKSIHHFDDKWGKSGMFYWNIDALHPIDSVARESLKSLGIAISEPAIHLVEQPKQRDAQQLSLWGVR
jgi:hypothetical protein